MLPQIFFFVFYEDLHYYEVYRMLHWPFLYKKIHKTHHENSAPHGLASEYAHPLETLFTGCGTVTGPVVYPSVILLFFDGNKAYSTHMVTRLTWGALRIFQTIDAHSGYDFP
jgi:methylsterol monooxygenase